MKYFALILALLALAACSLGTGDTPPTTPIPPTEALTGTVNIEYPLDGTFVYAEVLYVSGTASGIPDDEFELYLTGDDDAVDSEVAGADDSFSAEWTVHLQPDDNGRWVVELVHGYSGEPLEGTIYAIPADNVYGFEHLSETYDSASFVISGQSFRPEGTFGRIISPTDDATISGGAILVSGTASGIFENTFTVNLIDAGGSEINSEIVTVVNPYFIDEVPFSLELATNGYTGTAEIRAFTESPVDGSEIRIGSVNFTITEAN